MLIRFLIIIGVIAALVASGIFIKDYYDESANADSISSQIQNTQKNIAIVSAQTRNLEAELSDFTKRYANAQAAIEAEKNMMPDKMNSNSIVRSVLLLGQEKRVSVIPLSTRDWTTVKIDKHDYHVFRMDLELNGEESDIIEFIDKLQYSLYQTLVVEDVYVIKNRETPEPSGTPTPTATPVSVETVRANLSLAIYAK
ncbi:MAG: hypothetical protein NUV31_03950 [Dehalococcoidales bacterium]|jgi:hypothetical protein|nr:hypothetical protein [Dehalococcoidales bacterium]